MEIKEISGLLTTLLLIAVGIFIKYTKHENFQNVKRFSKPLIIIGSITLVLKIISFFQSH